MPHQRRDKMEHGSLRVARVTDTQRLGRLMREEESLGAAGATDHIAAISAVMLSNEISEWRRL